MIKIAVAGAGAIGSAVCRALLDGIEGFELTAISDLNPENAKKLIGRDHLNFVPVETISNTADWVVEALPAREVPGLAQQVLSKGKTLVAISSSALLLYPDIIKLAQQGGRILVPSGAIAGIDGIAALAEQGISLLKIKTTKPPMSYSGAPYIVQNNIDLTGIHTGKQIFAGHALEAAAAFPANINVAATLTLASRLSPEQVQVEAWADPLVKSNTHEIFVENKSSRLSYKIENVPSPENPKSSALTALSVIALLRRQTSTLSIP
jgi:aspartate dehydrogenase